jgi:hypothetical protein
MFIICQIKEEIERIGKAVPPGAAAGTRYNESGMQAVNR